MLPSVVGGAGEQPPVPFSVANADKGVSSGKEAQPELQAPSAGRRAGATGNDSGDRRTGAVAPVDAQAAATEAAVAASGGDPGERAAGGGTVADLPHVAFATSGTATNVVPFSIGREKRESATKQKTSTASATSGTFSWDRVQVSKGMWAYRLRPSGKDPETGKRHKPFIVRYVTPAEDRIWERKGKDVIKKIIVEWYAKKQAQGYRDGNRSSATGTMLNHS